MAMSISARKRVSAGLLLASGIAGHDMATAQTGFYLVPSVAVIEGHDDNLFFDIDDEQFDLFTRLSPALEAGYQSDQLNWGGRYSIDSEAYKNHTELDTWLMRRSGEAFFDYQPTDRLGLSAEATYTNTNTPVDLSLNTANVVQGFLLGRVEAERTTFRPAVEYRVTQDTTGELAYMVTNDELIDVFEGETQLVEAEFSTRFSAVNTLTYGYIYRQYEFDSLLTGLPVVQTEDQNSHTPWVGVIHAFGPRTTLTARGGPRYFGDSVDPFVLLDLRRVNANGQMSLTYEQNETILLGQVGRVNAETLSASIVHQFGPRFEVQFTPGYSEVDQDNQTAVEILRAGLAATFRVNDMLSFNASYDLNYQNVDFTAGVPDEKVYRNLVMLGFTLTWPRRTEEDTER